MAQRHRGRGALHIVAGLLLASALVRLLTEAGPAIAQATEIALDAPAAAEVARADDGSFLAAIQKREAALNEREALVDEKYAILQTAQRDLDQKLAEIIAAEEALMATIARAETAAETDIAQLTAVYENMKPSEAAALFEEMPPEFAAGFLGLMRADTAAAIMTELSPETAYSFSVVLAGRNAGVPTR